MSKFEEETEFEFKEEIYPIESIIEPLELKIKYHDPELIHIEQNDNSSWIDLRCAENLELKAGEDKLISLGVSIKVPDNWEGQIVPRSSTFKNWGILQVNSKGIIESNYASNEDIWKMWVYAVRDTKINKNDRICQFRIAEKQPKLNIIEVDDMEYETRGGFGSTGVQ